MSQLNIEAMIFDRTINDVELAKNIISQKIKKFLELTSEEIDILNRGTITVDTLNRIEKAQQHIKEFINDMGYWNIRIENREWGYSNVFKEKDFARIIQNLDELKNAFYVYSTTPKNPLVSFHFQNINDIEKILYDLKTMADNIKSMYLICGIFECGEV